MYLLWEQKKSLKKKLQHISTFKKLIMKSYIGISKKYHNLKPNKIY